MTCVYVIFQFTSYLPCIHHKTSTWNNWSCSIIKSWKWHYKIVIKWGFEWWITIRHYHHLVNMLFTRGCSQVWVSFMETPHYVNLFKVIFHYFICFNFCFYKFLVMFTRGGRRSIKIIYVQLYGVLMLILWMDVQVFTLHSLICVLVWVLHL